jgi:hypothetical protein
MIDNSNNQQAIKLEAILARELITLAQEHINHASTMESLSEVCFTLSRLFEEIGYSEYTKVDWNALFTAYDQRYYALSHDQEAPPTDAVTAPILKKVDTLITETNK